MQFTLPLQLVVENLPCFVEAPAFRIGVLAANVPAGISNIEFTIEFADENFYYNSMANTFHVFETSLYWFHLTAGVPSQTSAFYKLNGLKFSTAVYSKFTVFSQDCLTVDTLQWVSSSMSLSASTDQPLYSSLLLDTSVLGFRIDKLFSPLIAFAVQPTIGSIQFDDNYSIKFNRLLVNEGQGFQISNNTFVAPENGAYFFTFSSPGKVILVTNNIPKIMICNCADVPNKAESVVRGSVMLNLNKNDVVRLTVIAPTDLPLWNDDYGLTKFQGFLYKPKSTLHVAWSVAKTVAENGTLFFGPIDYLPYDTVNTNINFPWKIKENKVIIPVSGTYFLDLCSYPCGGLSREHYGEMQVMLNGNPKLISRSSPLTFNNCVTRSRSIILHLAENDVLWVRLPNRDVFYTLYIAHVTFSGFLL